MYQDAQPDESKVKDLDFQRDSAPLRCPRCRREQRGPREISRQSVSQPPHITPTPRT